MHRLPNREGRAGGTSWWRCQAAGLHSPRSSEEPNRPTEPANGDTL
jgi:hypothetical protein